VQSVPFVRFPVSVHTDVPVAHDVNPEWQVVVGEHATFAVQATHIPPLHTWLLPQEAPSVAA
jgi:hypothetical protein